MHASKARPASVPTPHEAEPAPECQPMIEQDMQNAHGHDMHPQKFVRLVGCHEESLRKADDEEHVP